MEVNDILNKVAQNLSVGRAFGTPYERDGVMIIPVALVSGGGGGGGGAATRGAVEDDDDIEEHSDPPTNDPLASGSGAGYGGVVMPVGTYVVKDGNVRWLPAINGNLLVICALLALRLVVRRRKTH